MSGRQRISSGGPWEARVGYSRAIRVGSHVWVSGTTGTRTDGTVPESAADQARLALETIERALADAGAAVADVVRVRVYVTDIEEWESVADALVARFGEVRPAMTMVEVSRLILPTHRVEIEVDAIVSGG
ncbi:MAG: Rid family hydrolase [Dehalococcoidia bacterium]